jgi:hypothetical protein
VARKQYPSWLPGSHPKSTVSPSNSTRNPFETLMVSPGPAFGILSLQRSLKWAKHPPGVSGESMTLQPSSRYKIRTVPVLTSTTVAW